MLSAQLNSGFKAGREAATIPIVSSMKFQMLKLSCVVQSGSSSTVHCCTALTIAAAHANHPRDKTAINDSFVRMFICSFQIKGTGSVAKRMSVTMLKTIAVSFAKSQLVSVLLEFMRPMFRNVVLL